VSTTTIGIARERGKRRSRPKSQAAPRFLVERHAELNQLLRYFRRSSRPPPGRPVTGPTLSDRMGEKAPRRRARGARAPRFELDFYQDETGRKPVLTWMKEELPIAKRRALGTAMREILQEQGIGVCGTAFGRQVGGGVFEFRLREEGLLLRVLCHAYGQKVVLLLAGYDKGVHPSPKRQQAEIALAQRRLEAWKAGPRGGGAKLSPGPIRS
jgi:phage-related protein